MALKIALLGDVCLTGKFDLESNPEAFRLFDQTRRLLVGYDIVLANLESPFTDQTSSRICKAIHIKSPTVNIHLLRYLGVTAVSLANNHMFDYGHTGHESTLAALEAAAIDHFGTGGRTFAIERGGERLLFGGFCCLSTHPSEANKTGVNILNLASFESFLEAACHQGTFPVVSVHWGDENIHYPRSDHVRFARLMSLEHSFLLHGTHPHVIQGLERRSGSLIAYSLGNFCTDQHRSRVITGLTVRHTLENRQSYILGVDIENGKIVSHTIIPIADTGDCLKVGDQTESDAILRYPLPLAEPYKRSHHTTSNAFGIDSDAPTRFSLRWFLRRLNYHFIGAFLKGVVNRLRYQVHFLKIRRIAAGKGID